MKRVPDHRAEKKLESSSPGMSGRAGPTSLLLPRESVALYFTFRSPSSRRNNGQVVCLLQNWRQVLLSMLDSLYVPTQDPFNLALPGVNAQNYTKA